MKHEKIINIIFYILTAINVLFSFQYFFSYTEESIICFIIFMFYIYSYYCHNQYKKYILKKYYIEKTMDTREPDVAMIEDFYHSLGFTDYKCNPEIKINDYSDDEIKEALRIYEEIKYGKEKK